MIPLSDPDLQRSTTPYVNVALIIINILIFAVQFLAFNAVQDFEFIMRYGLIPFEITSGTLCEGEILAGYNQIIDCTSPIPTWATIFSSMFLHGGFFHFAGNMLFLWVFGDNIEDYLGHVKYLIFYLLCGVAAALFQIMFNPQSTVPMIGASGAISGVMGAYILLYPNSQIRTIVWFIFITFMKIPAKVLLGIWFLMQIYHGLGSSSTLGGSAIAYWAHIGGFIAGLVSMKLFAIISAKHMHRSDKKHKTIYEEHSAEFSSWLKDQLIRTGLSPNDLATITNIDINTINNWLTNVSVPSQTASVFIAYALGVSVQTVLAITERNDTDN